MELNLPKTIHHEILFKILPKTHHHYPKRLRKKRKIFKRKSKRQEGKNKW